MASSVFFKFKSQKHQQRVTFDGTGISVFELKRDIIHICRLGDGTDFDLAIYNDHTNEEYDDDTTIVPRSTGVIARRLPASKPGQGRAARYVSGKMPVMAKNAYRTEQPIASSMPAKTNASSPHKPTTSQAPQTEEERIAEMMKAGADHFEQQKQQMASATPVFRPGAGRGKQAHVPDNPPPPGYVCFRCRQKGHWIQACPTNNDPKYENQPRFKRTTGIPRSMLKTVDQSEVSDSDGVTEEKRQPSHVMINSDGQRVIAVPDKASWEKYKAKADTSLLKGETVQLGDQELHDRGLECPIDKRLYIDPVKTPCCGKTYCNDCIENALVNSDLVCPNCSKEGVLIDDLTTDEDMVAKIKSYEEEKKALLKSAQSPRPAEEPATPGNEGFKSKSPTPAKSNASGTPAMSPGNPKKRSAEEQPTEEGKSPGPNKARKTESPSKSPTPDQQSVPSPKHGFKLHNESNQAFIEQMNALASSNGNPNGNPNGNSNFANMPFPMPPMMNPMMANGGMPPGMMNQMNAMMPGMGPNGMPPNGMPPFNPMMGMPGMNGMPNGMHGMGGYGGQGQNGFQQWGPNGPGGPGRNQQGQQNYPNQFGRGKFPNQQPPNDDDNAYMRRPLNPNRMGARQRKQRPADYREL